MTVSILWKNRSNTVISDVRMTSVYPHEAGYKNRPIIIVYRNDNSSPEYIELDYVVCITTTQEQQ